MEGWAPIFARCERSREVSVNDMGSLLKQVFVVLVAVVVLPLSMPAVSQGFIKGADVSWQTEQEAAGYSWKDDYGYTKPLHDILKDHSMNAVRLRVFVNPSDGWSNIADVVTKASYARDAGMQVMIAFHFSDSFADPAKQTPPAGWEAWGSSVWLLAKWHVRATLAHLANAGVTPTWVQIGNETSDGLLWPIGQVSVNGYYNYAKIITEAGRGAKEIFPDVKTIVHLPRGDHRALLETNLDGLASQGAIFDIIGLSLYPYQDWGHGVASYADNLSYLKQKYNKDVMLVEFGMNAEPVQYAYDALLETLNQTRARGGLGVFYWEPQGYNDWKGYTKHMWRGYNQEPYYSIDAFVWGGN